MLPLPGHPLLSRLPAHNALNISTHSVDDTYPVACVVGQLDQLVGVAAAGPLLHQAQHRAWLQGAHIRDLQAT